MVDMYLFQIPYKLHAIYLIFFLMYAIYVL